MRESTWDMVGRLRCICTDVSVVHSSVYSERALTCYHEHFVLIQHNQVRVVVANLLWNYTTRVDPASTHKRGSPFSNTISGMSHTWTSRPRALGWEWVSLNDMQTWLLYTFIGNAPLASKNASVHQLNWKKENMRKWKSVCNQVKTSKLTKSLVKAIASWCTYCRWRSGRSNMAREWTLLHA